MYELPHELPKDLKLTLCENQEILRNWLGVTSRSSLRQILTVVLESCCEYCYGNLLLL